MERVVKKTRGSEASPERTTARSVERRKEVGAVKPHSARAEPRAKHAYEKKTIALVYDFDGTLCPRPMQEYAFLPKIGVDAAAFWAESNRVALEQGADPLIT